MIREKGRLELGNLSCAMCHTRVLDDGTRDRYADEQLHALALYIYSLTPPPNPHALDDLTRRGEQIFERESCTDCHPAPLYTSNQLVRAPGFRPPAEHFERYDVSRRRVHTDAELAMSTRRGTG